MPTADLRRSLADAGFTPGARHVPAVIAVLGGDDEDDALAAEKALARMGVPGAEAALSAVAAATPPLRGRLVRVVGRVAAVEPGPLVDRLVALLADDDLKASRNAILALGKIRDARVEEALLARWGVETRVPHRRSLADALGKIGSPRALAALTEAEADVDAQVARLGARSRARITRDESRETATTIHVERALPRAWPVVLQVRAGLEPVLADELADMGGRVLGKGVVGATLDGPLSRLFVARTWLDAGLRLPPVEPREGLAHAIAASIGSKPSRELLAALTEGPIRYRLAFADGGHHRALVWDVAREVTRRAPELVNDPREAPWEIAIDPSGGAVRVELRPRAIQDPRFAYRKRDVPGASHPTIAAALARVCGAKDDDVVWDPFVGSGLELIERARLGPYASLTGTDTSDDALAAARENLASAGVTATLARADARSRHVPGVSAIVTNPPMGRRVGTRETLGPLLDAFLENAARDLVPGGRLVWISAMAGTARRAERLGLDITLIRDVDMGGFTAQLQRFDKPKLAGPAGPSRGLGGRTARRGPAREDEAGDAGDAPEPRRRR